MDGLEWSDGALGAAANTADNDNHDKEEGKEQEEGEEVVVPVVEKHGEEKEGGGASPGHVVVFDSLYCHSSMLSHAYISLHNGITVSRLKAG